jgi:hypothetical protein
MDFDPFHQQHSLVPSDGSQRASLHRSAQSFRIYHARRPPVASDLDLRFAVSEYVDRRWCVIVEKDHEPQAM